jgi:hypothetical protein
MISFGVPECVAPPGKCTGKMHSTVEVLAPKVGKGKDCQYAEGSTYIGKVRCEMTLFLACFISNHLKAECMCHARIH